MKSASTIAVAVFALSCSLIGGRCLAAGGEVTDQVLPNGIRILVQPEPDTSLVAIDIFVKTAGAPEDASHPGLANFTARALMTGTSNQSEDALAEQIGSLGGNIGATWDRNFTQLRALTLASRFDDDAYLLSDVLKNASFDPAAVQNARADLLQAFQDQSDNVYQLTLDQLRARLYAGDGITASELGNQQTIASLRTADLRAFFRKYYTADNIVIAIVGNIDPDHAVRVLAGDLADLDRRSGPHMTSALPSAVEPLTRPVTIKSYRGDLSSGYVMVGYLVPGAGANDYPDMLLLNALLGGMKTSLLFTNLREKQGLGYETASVYGEDVGISDLTGYILSPGDTPAGSPHGEQPDSDSDSVQTIAAKGPAGPHTPLPSAGPSFSGVRSALIDQFRLAREQPPTAAMLARAKRFVIGSYLTRHERLLDRAYWLGFSEIALKPLGGYRFDTHFADAVNAVSAADIQRVAQKYLSDGYVVSMTLPGNPDAGEVSR